MKQLLLTAQIVLLMVCTAMAQRTVSGKVTDSAREPLIGANVLVQGTDVGTVTDYDGNYTLAVPSGSNVLVVSYTGYTTQEITLGASNVADVVLTEGILLETAVVTALGLGRERQKIGYSVENVGGEKLQQVSEPDPLRALSAKVPGINIIGSSSVPGSATRITIRGNTSFLGENQPLFVVDGIPYDNSSNGASFQLTGGGAYGSRIADLDPNNIESISVLKGSAAAALYGSRASRGVIVVTTKTGKGRQVNKGLEVTLSSSYSLEEIASLPEYQNKYGAGADFNYQQANGSWGAAFNGAAGYPTRDSIPHWLATNPNFPEYFGKNTPYRAYPDNVSSVFQNGVVWDNSLTIRGGDQNTNFATTVSSLSQEGIFPAGSSQFDRNTLSIGGQTKLLNGIRLGGSFSYTSSKQTGPQGGANNAIGNSSFMSRTMFPGRNWDQQGLPFEDPVDRGSVYFLARAQAVNPYWSARYDGFASKVDRFVTAINLGFDVTDWISVDYNVGVNAYTQRDQEWFRPGSRGANGVGQIIDNDASWQEIESNLIVNFQPRLNNKDYTLRAFVGNNINQRTIDQQSFLGTPMIDFNIIDLDNTQSVVPNGGDYSRRRIIGAYAEAELGYRDYLYLTLTGRNDWSSTLSKGNNSYFYPAVSSSFIFTEALGIKSNLLSYGKLRASYARVGNDADPYSLAPTYSINIGESSGVSSGIRDIDFPLNGVSGSTLVNTEFDPNLTPEFTTEFELGTELQFFNRRVKLDVTYYQNKTTNQIARLSLPSVSGFDVLFTNFGELSNKGIEVGLNLNPISTRSGFDWNIYTTFTKNKNVVESLRDGVEEIVIRNLFGGSVVSVLRPGLPYGVIRGSVSARDEDGNLLIDPSNGQLINAPDPEIVGDPNPDFQVGLTNTFSYKGFSLNAVLDYRHGGDIYSYTAHFLLGRGVTKFNEDRERNAVIPGVYGDPNTLEPIRDEAGNVIQNQTMIEVNDLWFGNSFAINSQDEWNIFDGTTIRIREISLGYDLPKKFLERTSIGSLRLSISGRNLWYNAVNFPKYTHIDPETSTFGNANFQGYEYNNAPSIRRYGINLRATF